MRFFIAYILLCLPVAVSAARVEIVLPEVLTFDQAGTVHVILDTEGISINAVEGTLTFPKNLRVHAVETGSSALTLWLEGPTLSDNTVSFVGAIPNGLRDAHVPLLDIVFVADTLEASAEPFMGALSVFPNTDAGVGFPADIPSSLAWSFSTSSEAALLNDAVPPEPFSVLVTKDPNIFGGRLVALFSAVDKQSGMDYFELQEHETYMPQEREWKQVRSPVVLSDQSRSSYVSVKAVDRSGNIRIITVDPLGKHGSVIVLVVLLLGIVLIALYVFAKKRKN